MPLIAYFISCFFLLSTSHAIEINIKDYTTEIMGKIFQISEEDKEEVKKALFKEIVDQYIDIEGISKLVLGKHWHTTSDQQKEKFINEYKKYAITTYFDKIKIINSQNTTIEKYHTIKENKIYSINLKLNYQDGKTLHINMMVVKNKNENSFKIFDIKSEGISLVVTQKTEISSILANNSFDFLITKLQKHSQH